MQAAAPLSLLQAGRTYGKPVFEAEIEHALFEWNLALASINANENKPSTPQQIHTNRKEALNRFIASHDYLDLFFLSEAFRQLHGHWVNGSPPEDVIRKIFKRLADAEDSLSQITRYRSSLASMEGITVYRKPRQPGGQKCLTHPERRAVGRNLCSTCYTKAFRLSILHLSLGDWLTVLLKKRKPRDSSQCVNHAQTQSYADGHCVECLQRLGKLEKEPGGAR